MNIIITATGPTKDDRIDPRFGRAAYLVCLDSATEALAAYSNQENAESAQGAGIKTAQRVVDLEATVVITGDVGPKALPLLREAGIETFAAESSLSVLEAFEQWRQEKLPLIEQAGGRRAGMGQT